VLAQDAAIAAGWALYVVATAPPAPTVSPLSVVTGANIAITIAQNGSVIVYRNGTQIEVLLGKTIGSFNYAPVTDGGYSFALTNANGTSQQSTVVSAVTTPASVTANVFFPFELGNVYTDGFTNFAKIEQSGTFGEIITDIYRTYGASNSQWSINGGVRQTVPLNNIDLTALKGEEVHVRIYKDINIANGDSTHTYNGFMYYHCLDFKLRIGI
jgi:hypothetical protein